MRTEIDDIVNGIVAYRRPEKIFIFGSRARGDAREDSDVDIAVLYAGLEENPFSVASSLRMSLLSITTMPIDLLVYNAADFDRLSRDGYGLEKNILKEGSLAYG